MAVQEKQANIKIKPFDTRKSISRAVDNRARRKKWSIPVHGEKRIEWESRMERVAIIRMGLPYEAIDVISKKSNLPIKRVLGFLGVAQTTYNKKKRAHGVLDGRDSELILILSELLEFGNEVFNDELEKFQRWLKKTNLALGGMTPESLFDSVTGIQEVRNALNRLEFGNLA